MSTFKKYLEKNKTIKEPINEFLELFAIPVSIIIPYLIGQMLDKEKQEKYDREKISKEELEIIEKKAPAILTAIDDDELTKKFNEEIKIIKMKQAELEKQEKELTAKYDRDKKAEFFAKNRPKDFPSAEDLANTSNTSTASNSYRAQNPPQSAFKK